MAIWINFCRSHKSSGLPGLPNTIVLCLLSLLLCCTLIHTIGKVTSSQDIERINNLTCPIQFCLESAWLRCPPPHLPIEFPLHILIHLVSPLSPQHPPTCRFKFGCLHSDSDCNYVDTEALCAYTSFRHSSLEEIAYTCCFE